MSVREKPNGCHSERKQETIGSFCVCGVTTLRLYRLAACRNLSITDIIYLSIKAKWHNTSLVFQMDTERNGSTGLIRFWDFFLFFVTWLSEVV